MSEQTHSFDDDPRLASAPGAKIRTYETWTYDHGWCSACHGQDRRVVLFGCRDGLYHGICSYCLARLADAMRSAPSGGQSDG